MGGIETLIVLPVASLYFAVVPRCIRADQFMPDPVLLQMDLKQGGFILVRGKTVGELIPVIRLDTFNGTGKGFDKVIHKQGGGIGTVFLEGFYIAPSGIFINGGILEEVFSNDIAVHKAGRGNKFHIYLNTLAGVIHLLIRLRDIFGVGRMNSHNALFFQEAVEPRNGAGVTALGEFYPENDQTSIRVTPTHICDEFYFRRCVLVGMVVWSA